MAPALTPEQKNARMTEERSFLTKLLEGSLQGKLDVVKELVANYHLRDPSISQNEILEQFKDGKKRSALYFMCQSDHPTIIEDLKDWITDTDFLRSWWQQTDTEGMTALMVCAQHPDRHLACRRVLFALQSVAGPDLSTSWILSRSYTGATALHYAAGAGALSETIQALVHPSILNVPSRQGGTPLHWAAGMSESYAIETLKALVEDAGADLNVRNEHNLTPLCLAAAAGNDQNAKYFVQKGADIDVELSGKITIFHIAADCNLVGTLAALLDLHRDSPLIHQKNERGETPLDLAVQEGHVGCVMLLKGEKDEANAKSWMQNHKTTLPERQVTSTRPATVSKEDSKETESSSKFHELEERAKQAGAAAMIVQVTNEKREQAQALKQKGNQDFAASNFTSSAEWYTQAIDCDPTDATFYSNRAACWMAMRRYDDALHDAVVCRHLKPDWPKACYRMAVARLALLRYEDAAVAAWEGLQLDSENDELKRLLQKCVKQGRKQQQQNN